MSLINKEEAAMAVQEIKQIERALTNAFNPNLGMLDSKKLTAELKSAQITVQSMAKSFSLAGTQGQIAFNNVIGRLGQVDTGLKTISKTTDKVFNTIGNTVR